MGAAVSNNTTDSVVDAIASVTTEVSNDAKANTYQRQSISVGDAWGDVDISGNKFSQESTVSVSAALKSLVSQSMQQKLAAELSQKAKASISGLNLGNVSVANNDVNQYMTSSMKISTNISQTCGAAASQDQNISIGTANNVKVTGNDFRQQASATVSCIQDTVSNNAGLQDLSAKISQSAESKTTGLSLMGIMGILLAVACVLIAIPLGLAGVGKSIVKGLLGAIIFILPAGVTAAGGYLVYRYGPITKPVVTSNLFSTLIGSTPGCERVLATSLTSFNAPTASEASRQCESDTNCNAYDWRGSNVSLSGVSTPVAPSMTSYNIYPDKGCLSAIKGSVDKSNIMFKPTVQIVPKGNSPELTNLKNGDIVVFYNGQWHRWNSRTAQLDAQNAPLVDLQKENQTRWLASW